ncbi:MAG: tRNA (adenosine(37)-N6)-threonylcarbamoyltransferase complex ATPase subunit type 1 TsaE [Ktedonobacteraceae bacterium]
MDEDSLVTTDTQEEDALTLNRVSHSFAQTQRLGICLGELMHGGELILLNGQLGMGKTTFTQGLAQGLGITATINSPTFTLLKEYPGQPRSTSQNEQINAASHTSGPALYHFDLYRLDDPEEIFDLGFEDYFYDSAGVCVVEWADKADGLWVFEKLCISMNILSETKRDLLFTATGTRYHELLRQFQKNIYATTRS